MNEVQSVSGAFTWSGFGKALADGAVGGALAGLV